MKVTTFQQNYLKRRTGLDKPVLFKDARVETAPDLIIIIDNSWKHNFTLVSLLQ